MRNFIINETSNILRRFFQDYQEKPIKYFNDEDIRGTLFAIMSNNPNFNTELKNSKENKWLNEYENEEWMINGIKAKYPADIKFDIALIEPTNNENHYLNPCSIAIELKLNHWNNNIKSFLEDIQKLKKYKNGLEHYCAVAINFEQMPSCSSGKITNDIDNIIFSKVNEDNGSLIDNSINCYIITTNEILYSNIPLL